MPKEIVWNCQKQAFKNKRNILKAIEYNKTEIKNTVTEIKPEHFQDMFDNVPDEIEYSTVDAIKNLKITEFPTDYYKLPHLPKADIEENKKQSINFF